MQSRVPDADACGEGALLGGKYRLKRLLGEGGMGNVWLADNELLELPVALKIMRPEVRGGEAAARFLTEARVQAKLRHPNVARVFDYGETPAGDAYIVMELLEGYSLAEWLELRRGFTPAGAVQMLLPVIDALCAVHRAGVIHRDLKPDNIFIARSGDQLCPKLLDFGIAKLESEVQPRLTNPNGLLGSPAYMAPEQARGLYDVDQRADVWAACVVLYECITGEPAYDADSYQALLRAVIEHDLPPLEGPDTEDLWPILRAGLMRDRALRTPTMHELGVALAGWLISRGEYEDVCREPLDWRWSRPSSADVSPRERAVTVLTAAPAAEPRHATKRLRRGRRASSAALRLGLGASLGAGMLFLGMGQTAPESPAPEPELAQVAMAVAAAPPLPAARPAPPPPAAKPAPAPPPPVQTHEQPAPQPAPQGVEEPPRAAPPPAPAKPVLSVKRRAPASEAELGLKSPW